MARARAAGQSGISIVEAVLTLAVCMILLAMGAPGFIELVGTNRMASSINAFSGALTLARSEAAKRNTTVAVCATTTGTSCDATAQWTSGWLVFVNTDNDSALDAGETVLAVGEPQLADFTLRGEPAVKSFISFGGSGTVSATGMVVLCYRGNVAGSKAIFINAAGRIGLAPDADADGVPEDPNGTDLTTCAP